MKFSVFLFVLNLFLLLPHSYAQQPPSLSSKNVSSDNIAKYIGLRYDSSLPDGLKKIGGSLVSDVNDTKVYSISQIHKGKVKMLWLELTNRKDSDTAYSVVKDVLVLPEIPKDQVLVWYSACLINDGLDNEIVAIAYHQPDKEYYTRIHRAWRANRETEKFEEISVRGIKCENIGYGV